MVDLTVILPVHNESAGIEKNLKTIIAVLKKLKISYEIICMENGSTDITLSVLKSLQKKIKELVVMQSQIGWGNAVRKGIQKAGGMYTCYMVSDGQIDPEYIEKLYEIRKHAALVKIWRTTRENGTRLLNSRIYNILARILFGIDTQDVNATPKLLETKLLKSIPLTANNIAVDLELLLALKKRGLTWYEIPAPSLIRDTGSSTTRLKTVWEMVRWMIVFRLHI